MSRKTISLLLLITAALLVFGLFGCEKTKEALSLGKTSQGPQGKLYKLLFVGDTSFAESYGKRQIRLLEKHGYDYPLEKVNSLLTGSDFVITNLETPITNLKESPFEKTKTYVHWTHYQKAPASLKRHNMMTFGLANNHTLDYGVPGIEQTFEIMKENGMEWFGAGMNEAEAAKPFTKTFTIGDQKLKVAVIAPFERSNKYQLMYSFYAEGDKPGAYMLSQSALRKQIQEIKAKDPDTYVIVFPHWGANYKWKNKRQTANGHAMIDAGADLVIGHGGHAMQEIEKYKDKWIVYGLGNFMFLTGGRYSKFKIPPYSYAAQLVLADNNGKLEKWMRLYPILTDNRVAKYQVRPLNAEEFGKFTTALLTKSPLKPQEAKSITEGEDQVGHYLQFRID